MLCGCAGCVCVCCGCICFGLNIEIFQYLSIKYVDASIPAPPANWQRASWVLQLEPRLKLAEALALGLWIWFRVNANVISSSKWIHLPRPKHTHTHIHNDPGLLSSALWHIDVFALASNFWGALYVLGRGGVAAGGFHLNLLSTQLHACQLCVGVGVCVWVCVRPFGPKPCQVFGQSVCQSAISMPPSPIVNRQRQSMRQSVRQLVTYSMRCCCIDSLDLWADFFMRCCLTRCTRNVGNAFFCLPQ